MLKKSSYFNIGIALLGAGILFIFLIFPMRGAAFPLRQPVEVDSHSTQDGSNANIVVDKSGTIHIAYAREDNGDEYIYYVQGRYDAFNVPVLIGQGIDPSLVVSPEGVVHIAYREPTSFWDGYLWYATDSGSSSFITTQLGLYDKLDHVSLVADNMVAYIVFEADGIAWPPKQVVYYTDNASGTFAPPTIISEGIGEGVDDPEATLDSDNNIHIIYSGAVSFPDEWLFYTNNISGNFMTPITSTTNVFSNPENFSLGVTSNGDVHIGYSTPVGPVMYTSVVGNNFAEPVEVDNDGKQTCIVVNEHDIVHFFYQDSTFDHSIKYMNNQEGTFSTPSVIYSDTPDSYNQRGCSVNKNFIHLAFSENNSAANPGVFYYLHNAAIPIETFDEMVHITDDQNARIDTMATIAVDNDNHAHVAYASWYPKIGAPDGIASDIMITNDKSGTFSTPIAVSVSDDYHYSAVPSVAADGNGFEHLVFMRKSSQTAADGIFYYTHNRSGSFATPIPITTNGEWTAQIVAHDNGSVRIVYPQYIDGGTKLFYVDNLGGSLSTPILLGEAGSFAYFSMILDKDEHMHIVWQGSNRHFYYTNDVSGTFAPPIHISIADPLIDIWTTRPSLAIDSQGYAHIAFRAISQPIQEQMIYLNNVGGSFAYTETVRSQGNIAFSPSIAVDKLDHIHLVYLSSLNPIEYTVNRGNGFMPPEIIWPGGAYGTERYFVVDDALQGHLAFYHPINSVNSDIGYLKGFVGDYYQITGYVLSDDDTGLEDAIISFTDATNSTLSTMTDSSGYFSMGNYDGVFAPGTYTVAASSGSIPINPAQQVVSVAPDQGLIFNASCSPPTPPGVAITIENETDVNLDWSANPGSNVSSYRIYRGESPYFSPGDPGVAEFTTSATTYVDLGVVGNIGLNYYYAVASVNDCGISPQMSNHIGEFDFAVTSGS